MTQFQLGSISTGTLRPEDLLPAFTYKLGELAHNPVSNTSVFKSAGMAEIWQGAIDTINAPDYVHDYDELLDGITDALQEYCPPFVYFGAHPGDGADFGFWPDIDGIQEIVNIAECDASQGISCPDDGVIVQVSDHGNVTVMDMERNVIWSVV